MAIVSLLAAACGGDDDDSTSSGGEETATFESPQEGVFTDRVDVGVIYDQTGATASTQTVFFAGVESYVNSVNEDGGVNGRQINLLQEDEKYDVPTAVAAYNKLVNQTPTVAIMGLNNSSFQGAVIEDVAQDEIPIVGAESTTKAALNPFNPWFFALQCTYTDQADVAVAYLINKTGIENPTAVALYGDVASGQEWSGLIEERITAAGGEFMGGISITYGSTEADAQAQEIASLDPDMIFLHGGVVDRRPCPHLAREVRRDRHPDRRDLRPGERGRRRGVGAGRVQLQRRQLLLVGPAARCGRRRTDGGRRRGQRGGGRGVQRHRLRQRLRQRHGARRGADAGRRRADQGEPGRGPRDPRGLRHPEACRPTSPSVRTTASASRRSGPTSSTTTRGSISRSGNTRTSPTASPAST